MDGQGLALGEESRAIVVYPDSTRLELIGETTVRSLSDSRAAGSSTPGKGKTVVLEDGLLRAEVAKQPEGRPMIVVWEVATGQERATLYGHWDSVLCLAYAPDSRTPAAGCKDGTVKLWDVQAAKELLTLEGHGDAVLAVAFAPDGQVLATGSRDKTVRLWDLRELMTER